MIDILDYLLGSLHYKYTILFILHGKIYPCYTTVYQWQVSNVLLYIDSILHSYENSNF